MKFIFLEVCRIDRRSRCWFRWRRRKLTCRTAKPGFEACLAKLGRIARHDTALAQLGAEVACLWICNDLARIVKCAESCRMSSSKRNTSGPAISILLFNGELVATLQSALATS